MSAKLADLQFLIEERGPKGALLESLRVEAFRGTRPPFKAVRRLNFSVALDAEKATDRLVTISFPVHVIGDGEHIVLTNDVAAAVNFSEKRDYVTVHGSIYATNRKALDAVEQEIKKVFADVVIHDPMFRLVWHFSTDKNETRTAIVEERADDVLNDASYPAIGDVRGFVHDFINSQESILVLIGPPGTGKTRLIRFIMGEMARGVGRHTISEEESQIAQAAGYDRADYRVTGIYSSDNEVLSRGAIFADFLIGDAHVLIVEDADHLLKSRSSGNDKLHYFLSAADGVIRAQSRKIIFSTNLPNVTDVDDALIRPGRCFSVLHLRHLSPTEAVAAAKALGRDDYVAPKSEVTLAEVYKWHRDNPRSAPKPKPKKTPEVSLAKDGTLTVVRGGTIE